MVMNSSIEETPSAATDIGEQRKTDEKSRRKVKRKRRDVKDGGIAPEWQSKFFQMESAVSKKTTTDTKGPLKCFVKRKIGRWSKPMPFLLDSKIFSKI